MLESLNTPSNSNSFSFPIKCYTISRTTEPILGMFVLIWIAWLPLKLTFGNMFKKLWVYYLSRCPKIYAYITRDIFPSCHKPKEALMFFNSGFDWLEKPDSLDGLLDLINYIPYLSRENPQKILMAEKHGNLILCIIDWFILLIKSSKHIKCGSASSFCRKKNAHLHEYM